MPWLDVPTFFVPMWTYEVDRTPFAGDPRHALARVLDRYATRGWQVVAATELEFYLVDDSHENLSPHSIRKGASPCRTGLYVTAAVGQF